MRVLVLCTVVAGIAAADLPSTSYGVPNGASGNGFGASGNGFGASGNGFGASGNGFGASANGFGGSSNGYGYGQDEEIVALSESIPGGGVPGEDYPILASVPDTGFSCDAQAVADYYADTAAEAGCQVFHISESFYSVNELIGVVPDAGYAYGAAVNGNGNGSNGYGSNGNGINGNGSGSGSNGNVVNGNGSNGNGNGSPVAPSTSYGAPF
ncbi:pro-resilin-like [Penaeus indicus]|uniref:pro-resilin-like n=1 Tax=Penaeus indicus TaxID=29960 RepID=UPI00300D4719